MATQDQNSETTKNTVSSLKHSLIPAATFLFFSVSNHLLYHWNMEDLINLRRRKTMIHVVSPFKTRPFFGKDNTDGEISSLNLY